MVTIHLNTKLFQPVTNRDRPRECVPKMNAVYAEFFKSSPPARATVEVARLPRDVKVEIAMIAGK